MNPSLQRKLKNLKSYRKAAPFLRPAELLFAAQVNTAMEIRQLCEEDPEIAELLGRFRYRRG